MNELLERELEIATRRAFEELFKNHPEEYYYCTLISQECAIPYIFTLKMLS